MSAAFGMTSVTSARRTQAPGASAASKEVAPRRACSAVRVAGFTRPRRARAATAEATAAAQAASAVPRARSRASATQAEAVAVAPRLPQAAMPPRSSCSAASRAGSHTPGSASPTRGSAWVSQVEARPGASGWAASSRHRAPWAALRTESRASEQPPAAAAMSAGLTAPVARATASRAPRAARRTPPFSSRARRQSSSLSEKAPPDRGDGAGSTPPPPPLLGATVSVRPLSDSAPGVRPQRRRKSTVPGVIPRPRPSPAAARSPLPGVAAPPRWPPPPC